MTRLIFTAVCLLAMAALAEPPAAEPPARVPLQSAGQKAAAGTPDKNVKHKSEKNDPRKKIPAPPEKGGPKARGVTCRISVDNWTGYKVQLFIDGDYSGLIIPWGELATSAITGRTTVYARAEFEDTSYVSFGPVTLDCQDGRTYAWKLQ